MAISAADIIIPPKETSVIEEIRTLVNDSGPNKGDQVIVLCVGCIQARWNNRRQIIEVGMWCGLSNGHITKILKMDIGVRWRLDRVGLYSLAH